MNRQELHEKMLDEMLAYVANERMEELALECDAPPDVYFTPRLKGRISRIISRMKRRERAQRFKRAINRTGVLVAVHIVIIGAVALHIGAQYVPALNLFGAAGGGNAAVHESVQEKSACLPEPLRGIYMPAYVPRGYKIQGVDKERMSYTISYKGPGGAELMLKELPDAPGANGADESGQAALNGAAARFVISGSSKSREAFWGGKEQGVPTLVFRYDKNEFVLTGPVEEDEMEKVALSLKITQ